MYDSYGIVRLALKYERLFENDFERIRNQKEFYMNELRGIIEQADDALELESEQIADWGKNIQTVYEVDDANTLWKKFELFLMKLYVNRMYSKAVEETRKLQIGKEKLEKLYTDW